MAHAAVDVGKRVRVVLRDQTYLAFEPESLIITNNYIAAEKTRMMEDASGRWTMKIVNTKGYLHQTLCNIGEDNCTHSSKRSAVDWFVDERHYAKLYETDGSGNVIEGSLIELREAAMSGATIRVAYGNTYKLFTAAEIQFDTESHHLSATFGDFINNKKYVDDIQLGNGQGTIFWVFGWMNTNGMVHRLLWRLNGTAVLFQPVHNITSYMPVVWYASFIQEGWYFVIKKNNSLLFMYIFFIYRL